MNDAERLRLAYQTDGGRWIGPTERQRCEKHPRRWVLFRWEWHGERDEDSLSGGEPVFVRSCGACVAEERDAWRDAWDE